MSKVEIRIKNKQLTKMALGPDGTFTLTGFKAQTDLVSKGITAQPANPLTAEENVGLNGPAPSATSTSKAGEPGTTGNTDRLLPQSKLEADKQPELKHLEEAPSQSIKTAMEDENKAAPKAPALAPHQTVPAATSKSVLKESGNKNTSNDASASANGAQTTESKTSGNDASTSVEGKQD